MNRIEERLTALKEEGKKAFITYTTAGLPDYDTTKKLMFAQEEAGIDIMEIGVPFSDPIADGPVIQDASFKAIQNGASLEGTFTMMGEVRKAGLNSPVVFMLYYNTVYHYGVEDLSFLTFHSRSRARLRMSLQRTRSRQFLSSLYLRYLRAGFQCF